MIPELGHFLLILAFCTALVQTAVPAYGAWRRNSLTHVAVPAALAQVLLIAGAFAALTYAYVTSDFSVVNVAENSHTLKPMLYKVTGVWGNHEGSMLLWVLILAAFGAAIAWFGGGLPSRFRALVLSVQGSVGVAFLAFILFTSNPFWRLLPGPLEGESLNPLLQDPGLAFHPPMLYAGYVGLSVAYSFAIAALIEGRVDAVWARWVRPWTLAAWTALTLGIAMGSWWAYYELGWGGWWAWDPVENASFIPWLAATALVHSAIVVERREALKTWTVLLAILAFSASLLGTFLVRSGVLTSVHAFATDPERGVFVLAILAFFVGGGLALYAWRAPSFQGGGVFAPISRESGLLLNNIVLSVSAAAVLFATLYPLLHEQLTGRSLSVGPQVYNTFFPPIMALALVAMPLGVMSPWKRGSLAAAFQPLIPALAQAVAAAAIVLTAFGLPDWAAALAFGLAVWIVAGTFTDAGRRAGSGSWAQRIGRMRLQPAGVWGMALAHGGTGVLVAGIAGVSAWNQEGAAVLKPGQGAEIAGYMVRMRAFEPAVEGPNYSASRATLEFSRDGQVVAVLAPERRSFPARSMETTEAAIASNLARDLYVAVGETHAEGTVVRVFVKPLVAFIWLGAILMALGGCVSLADRRFRIGVGHRAAAAAALPPVGVRP
jgi:cytochrome c-type biogenesis protein CcmF